VRPNVQTNPVPYRRSRGITEKRYRQRQSRYDFWQKIDDHLGHPRIGKRDHCRIQEALTKKVPEPRKAEGEQARK
jgi:hypothetical protein